MSDGPGPPSLGRELLEIAAKQISPLLRESARILAPARALADDPGVTVLNSSETAIDRFGPAIECGWTAWLAGMPAEDQHAAIRQVARFAAEECLELAAAIFAPLDASPADKTLGVDYIAAIPASARNAIWGEFDTGRASGGATSRRPVTSHDLHRILPTVVPPFPIGHEVAGTPYRLVELLGCGGFGAVYKAVNRFEQHAAPRALKFCLNPSLAATLDRERALLDRLMESGQNESWSDRVVKLYGHSLDHATPFLVYECVPGGSLPAYLGAGRWLGPDELLAIMRQLLEALAFAHSRRLVHRDIKPANILVDQQNIKLADFGIGGVVSRHAAQASQIGVSALGQLSMGERVSVFRGSGTPLYMSPEQRRGDDPDPRHDLYSVGVVWYQLLVGDVSRELHPGWDEELTNDFDAPRTHVEMIRHCVAYIKKRPENAVELLKLFQASHSRRGSGIARWVWRSR